MKRIITLLFTTLIVLNGIAQAPYKMSYQAVIRNASNSLVINSNVGMRISVLQGSASGSAVYVETQMVSTNTNGLVSLEIGGGTVISGSFSTIDWANGPYYLQTETDPTGGTAYSITGTNQFLSVPYAFYASTTNDTTIWKKYGNTIYYPGRIGIGKKNTTNASLNVAGRFMEIASDSAGSSGIIKNIPLNTPGYDGSLILGFAPYYSTIELHHQLGGFNGGSSASNFYTTFNSTEGGISAGERMRIAPNGNVGIGINSPVRTLHVKDVIRLEPINTPPTSPSKGDIYFDNILNKLRVYDGTTWQSCW